MAIITSSLTIQLDLTKPLEELTQVITAVILSFPPENRKKILEGLDLEVGNALAAIVKEEAQLSEDSKEEEKS